MPEYIQCYALHGKSFMNCMKLSRWGMMRQWQTILSWKWNSLLVLAKPTGIFKKYRTGIFKKYSIFLIQDLKIYLMIQAAQLQSTSWYWKFSRNQFMIVLCSSSMRVAIKFYKSLHSLSMPITCYKCNFLVHYNHWWLCNYILRETFLILFLEMLTAVFQPFTFCIETSRLFLHNFF